MKPISKLPIGTSLLRSLPASVAAGTIVAYPIPPAPGVWPFVKLLVAGVVAGAIYGSSVPGTAAGQSNVTRGGKAGMAVAVPAFLVPLAISEGSLDVVAYLGPLLAFLIMICPLLIVFGMVPGAIGGAVGNRVDF